MPLYRYTCTCGHNTDSYRTIAERDNAPEHCGKAMARKIMPAMVSVFNPYRAVAAEKDGGERPIIRNRAEHEAFLRRNGYEEVGNDHSMAPLSREEIMDTQHSKKAENVEYNLDVDTMEASR